MRRFTVLLAIAVVISLVGLPAAGLLVADGGDPLPIPPANSVLSADGGDPLPIPPALSADGGDPLPIPPGAAVLS